MVTSYESMSNKVDEKEEEEEENDYNKLVCFIDEHGFIVYYDDMERAMADDDWVREQEENWLMDNDISDTLYTE